MPEVAQGNLQEEPSFPPFKTLNPYLTTTRFYRPPRRPVQNHHEIPPKIEAPGSWRLEPAPRWTERLPPRSEPEREESSKDALPLDTPFRLRESNAGPSSPAKIPLSSVSSSSKGRASVRPRFPGQKVKSPRLDWSAVGAERVCIYTRGAREKVGEKFRRFCCHGCSLLRRRQVSGFFRSPSTCAITGLPRGGGG